MGCEFEVCASLPILIRERKGKNKEKYFQEELQSSQDCNFRGFDWFDFRQEGGGRNKEEEEGEEEKGRRKKNC